MSSRLLTPYVTSFQKSIDSFPWLQRIKVALGIASLLKFLHTEYPQYPPFIVCNLDAAHILLDENGYPRLCDFSMITGGIFPDRTVNKNDHAHGCDCHIDPYAGNRGGFRISVLEGPQDRQKIKREKTNPTGYIHLNINCPFLTKIFLTKRNSAFLKIFKVFNYSINTKNFSNFSFNKYHQCIRVNS